MKSLKQLRAQARHLPLEVRAAAELELRRRRAAHPLCRCQRDETIVIVPGVNDDGSVYPMNDESGEPHDFDAPCETCGKPVEVVRAHYNNTLATIEEFYGEPNIN